jgi:pimeloyl-ACP methyl ester carboxylesterase
MVEVSVDDVRSDRVALIVPGRGYGPDAPLLDYATWAAANRGADTSAVVWQRAGEIVRLPPDECGREVCAQVVAHLDTFDGRRPLLIGKSLGSHAAALAAERGLPAVWLTPVLTSPWVVAALRRATAPALLIGGTADGLWDGALARDVSGHVLEIDDANHGMFVPGPLARSAAVLGRVATAIEAFLDEVVWPTR